MATIEVEVVFDTQTILANYPNSNDVNNPTAVDNSLVFMIVKAADAISGQGGAELNLQAQTEDTLRWRESTPTLDYDAIMYQFVASQPNILQQPQALLATVTVPLPNPNPPYTPAMQTIQDYFWNSTVLNPTTPGQPLVYHFQFMITDRGGNVRGYYQWDPFITVSS